MPFVKDQKNIKVKIISYIMLVIVLYYVHEVFRFVSFDVLHLHHSIWGTSFEMHSLIPFADYGEDVQMDIQFYVWKLCTKLNLFFVVHLLYHVLKTLNILDNPIPGFFDNSLRLVRGFRAFCIFQIGFFLLFDGQQGWWYSIIVFIGCFLAPFLNSSFPRRIQEAQKQL